MSNTFDKRVRERANRTGESLGTARSMLYREFEAAWTCEREGCGHELLVHDHLSDAHPCTVIGCGCGGYQRKPKEPLK